MNHAAEAATFGLNRAWESTVFIAMTQMDLPSEPEDSGRPEQARTERLRPKSRELPDPDERGRA